MGTQGIDAGVELAAEIDRLTEQYDIAKNAPRGKGLYRFLMVGLNHADPAIRAEYQSLTDSLIIRLGVWWSPETYQQMPVLAPWCIRDRSARYDQGPEAWGSPREDGYLRDDNSIVKKLPLPVTVEAPERHPYAGRRPWRGFTACHVWGPDVDGAPSGRDPWLYTFVPNLVWLPRPLADLTDRQGSRIQHLLMRTARSLYVTPPPSPSIAEYASASWSRLPIPPYGPTLPLEKLCLFQPDSSFFKRRLDTLEKFVRAATAVLEGSPLAEKVVCSRYTREFPLLNPDSIREFRGALEPYHDAVSAAIHVQDRANSPREALLSDRRLGTRPRSRRGTRPQNARRSTAERDAR